MTRSDQLSRQTVVGHIVGGNVTVMWLESVSGWTRAEIKELCRELGYGVNAANGKFQPITEPKEQPAGVLLANASERTAPRSPDVRPAYQDLIEEGKASSVVKVQRAAVKAKVALEQLSHLLVATRASERMRAAAEAEKAALRAELEQIKAREAELKAKLRGVPAPARPLTAVPETGEKPASKRPPIDVDYRALDAWCQETGRPWRKQGMGRPSNALIAEYKASLEGGAA